MHTNRHKIKTGCDENRLGTFGLLQSVFRPSGPFPENNTGLLPDPTKQQQIVKGGNDGPCGLVLTTVETNQTAEV